MTPANQQLLNKLHELLGRIKDGDREARATALKLKQAAKNGDVNAQLAFNTLSAIYWERNTPTWKLAEAYYRKLIADDRETWERFKRLQSNMHRCDRSKKAFAMLKSIHNHRKRSVWYPGAPKIGYYPMPTYHRPGISIPSSAGGRPAGMRRGPHPNARRPTGNRSSTGAPLYPGGPDLSLIPGLSSIPGLLPPVPNAPSAIPGLPGWPVIPGLPMIPGLPSYPPPLPAPPADYLPLTQLATAGLLQLISQARQSIPANGGPMMMAPAPSSPFVTTVPKSTASSTVQRLAQTVATITRPPAPATTSLPVKTLGKRTSTLSAAELAAVNAQVDNAFKTSAGIYGMLTEAIRLKKPTAVIKALTTQYNNALAAGK